MKINYNVQPSKLSRQVFFPVQIPGSFFLIWHPKALPKFNNQPDLQGGMLFINAEIANPD